MFVPPKVPEEKPQKPTILFSICEIRPHLFIAGYGAITEKKLKDHGITHVVDCTNIPKSKCYEGIEYFDVPVDDSEMGRLNKYFESSAEFIEQAKSKGGKTIVYCAAGVSRSAALCMVYLMISEKITLEESYIVVCRARPLIAPNNGFWRQMIDFEKEKTGQNTVQLLKGMNRPVPSVYLNKSKIIGST
ncbi:unnamed protein product [Bursaphelenchus okinawaensis]|uniref:Protein-tyrosine-phosphatase n=1 Tax=Bursaphelenchus okinawaensis TaxID=465554 RepID=A0A811LSJ7_9BILA|nr:unnamed protein product [Bursaphelenchus okinawaensis]CAG9127463.1 unnamed protein product [Bursaphelenchus okinawaensis]